MIKFLKRFFDFLLGTGNKALDSIEEKGVVAKQNLEKMTEEYENMKLAIAGLEAKVIISAEENKKAYADIAAMDAKIDFEMANFSEMPEGDVKDKQKSVIEAYIQKHSDLTNKYEGTNKIYLAQKSQLDKYKADLAQSAQKLEDAKFSTAQIEINDTINKAKGVINRKGGFNKAEQQIHELKKTVEEQSLANDAYNNLGKTEADLLIEEHEKTLKNVNLSDAFASRLAKAQKKHI